MSYSRDQAYKIWDLEIGTQEYGYDFSGKKIKKEEYGKPNEVGWIIAHIKPEKLGGPDNDGNIMIMHHRTLAEKGFNYPEFAIDHKRYRVCHEEKKDYYYIEEIVDEDEDD